jgi:ectoine hydroxylase-related dioxygenase (phytanoyl-CoA dioxygenase family)
VLGRPELDALDRDGYAVVPDALDRATIEQLRRAFELTPQVSGTQHVRVADDTPEAAVWRGLGEHPAAVAAARHILGRPYRVREIHGRNPLPGFGQQGLHADWVPRTPGSPYFVVTTLWMIDDFTPDNGATRIVPGSHLISKPLPKPLAQPLSRHVEERIVTGRAGSMLVFNGHLWHSGRRNDSANPRRAAQMVMVAD